MKAAALLLLLTSTCLALDAKRPVPGPPGPQGIQGVSGKDGEDAHYHSVDVGLGVGAQYKDTKDWNVGGAYNYFIRNNEHRLLPVVFTYKLGKDHQDEKIRALEVQLDTLNKILERVSKTPNSVSNQPDEPTMKATIRGKK